ncbi:MAG: DUF4301 family protein [Bacteroidales bacterium]|nr:DUF4301 family protein [Bacteroidales bacterium]
MIFTKQDTDQLKNLGISRETVEKQIENFVKGFPYIQIVSAAIPDHGILPISAEETDLLVKTYDNEAVHQNIVKFVPASGAASRMFKHLFEFRGNYDGSTKSLEKLWEKRDFNSTYNFLTNIKKFAFSDLLDQALKNKKSSLDLAIEKGDYNLIISTLLDEEGLNYANLPKGLLYFHSYNEGSRMSIEEHLAEGAGYATGKNSIVKLHFTVSPEHLENFNTVVKKLKPMYEKRYGLAYDISFSIQKSSTNTIAVNPDNTAFREADGSLLFRPGGHGALIQNLNEIDADIIFVKNIDNIVSDSLRDDTILYKKVLAGLLIKIRNKTQTFVHKLHQGENSVAFIQELEDFATGVLQMPVSEEYYSMNASERIIFWNEKYDCPIRVCGMVKNEGEPGGGPFVIRDKKGLSLQIVEGSQIDLMNPAQKALVQQSTHFNPVDLVCSTRDAYGKKYDLNNYIDHDAGFISEKSKDGRNLKAQELPGLWNGAMARWLTVFVEVPIITFNPVKTVNDLLRPEHQ